MQMQVKDHISLSNHISFFQKTKKYNSIWCVLDQILILSSLVWAFIEHLIYDLEQELRKYLH